MATRADLSPAFDRIVRHCLEKNPAERFQTARDVAFALDALSGTSTGSAAAPVVEAPRRRFGLAAALVALPILGIAGGFALAASLRPAAAPDLHLSVLVPRGGDTADRLTALLATASR